MKTFLMKALRKCYRSVVRKEYPRWNWPNDNDWETTNDIIYNLLIDDTPCYIGRIGTVEGAIVHNRLTITPPDFLKRVKGCYGFVVGNSRLPWWDMGLPVTQLQKNAGFFSREKITEHEVCKFADLYLHYIPLMDVCGRFEYYEKFLPFSPDCRMVQLESLYPFFVERPWMKALEGKRILVIHPFKETIEKQYSKREKLFSSPESLPEFDLVTYKAVSV